MVAKKFAKDTNRPYEDMKLVIVHLGSGISITSHIGGRMIDANNANDEGPLSPQRAGTLPITQLAKLCYSGKYPDEKSMSRRLTKEGGLYAHIGSDDLRDLKKKMLDGDAKAGLLFRAMGYQIAKFIGSYAATIGSRPDAILITGGMAHEKDFMANIRGMVDWIAPVHVYAGEDELEALTPRALRVLRGEEKRR
jgi:butyrate kinase